MECVELFENIDKIENKYLDILEDVCNIESPTDYKEGVDAVGAYFVKMAEAHGWQTEVFEQEISGNVVCITLNPDASKPPLSLSGHIDTVFPVGMFPTPAVRRDDEKMYGPGVMDCKGGVVAAFMALEALEMSGFTDRPIQLILQSDEENGSASSGKATIKYMCEKARGSVGFLNLEGHKSDTAVLRRKGILRYLFTVHGRALHSARCTDAANAVAEAAHKIIELEKMKNPDGLTCNCGVIQGGSKPNSVAEKCCFYADIRFASPDEAEQARQIVKNVAYNQVIEGCSCTLDEVSYRPPMPKCGKNDELLLKMNEIYEECGMPTLVARASLSGSDAAYITECGIPCVDCIGTEGSNIHSADEYIELKSLRDSAKRIAAVAYCI